MKKERLYHIMQDLEGLSAIESKVQKALEAFKVFEVAAFEHGDFYVVHDEENVEQMDDVVWSTLDNLGAC